MAWPIIAAIAISVASKIAGGMTGASSLSSNAQTAMDVGASNAQAALNVGKWNADAIIDMAKINMELGTFSSMLLRRMTSRARRSILGHRLRTDQSYPVPSRLVA